MARGRLDPPNLDDRTFDDLVAEVRRLIPAYAPEHTDLSPSDPLIALTELFAWLVEGLTYRLNRVTERNYIAFLNLIGVRRNPATPAKLWLACTVAPGGTPVLIERGARAQTPQVDETPPIVFETDRDLSLVPANLVEVVGIQHRSYFKCAQGVAGPPLSGLTVKIPPGPQPFILALGFDANPALRLTLRVGMRTPFPSEGARLTVVLSDRKMPPAEWRLGPGELVDGTGNLTSYSGDILVSPPPSGWTAQAPEPDWSGAVPARFEIDEVRRALFWVGLKVENLLLENIDGTFEHVLFNAVEATNALSIDTPEMLGEGDGTAFQSVSLANRPLYKKPETADPYEDLVVEVREPTSGAILGPWQVWPRCERFPAGDVPAVRVDPVTGDLLFGDYHPRLALDGRGRRPPQGAEIRAKSYRHVAGGRSGNVAPGAVTVLLGSFNGVTGVRNPGRGTGGSDEEPIEDALRRGPETLRNRDRAVTAEDMEYLAKQATSDVAIVRALPPRATEGDPWTYGGLNRSISNVNVIVVPWADLDDPRPTPSPELIEEVAEHLNARRVVSSNLLVTGPRYLPIHVTLRVVIFPEAVSRGLVEEPSSNVYRDALHAQIEAFLHPVRGRQDGSGWAVGESVSVAELFSAVTPKAEIGFVRELTLAFGRPEYVPPDRPDLGTSTFLVRLADYELPCSAHRHTVDVEVAGHS